MARREFPRAIKVAVIKRATRDSVVYCEACQLPAKKWQIDHVRPDGLLGEPTIDNAQLICEACFGIKNPADTTAIARAKRREAAHIGARTVPVRKIANRGFAKSEKAARRVEKPKLAMPSEIQRRFMKDETQ